MGLSIKKYSYGYSTLNSLRKHAARSLGKEYYCNYYEGIRLGKKCMKCILCLCDHGFDVTYPEFFLHSDCDGGYISSTSKQVDKYHYYGDLDALKEEVKNLDPIMLKMEVYIYVQAWKDFRDDVLSARKLLHFR